MFSSEIEITYRYSRDLHWNDYFFLYHSFLWSIISKNICNSLNNIRFFLSIEILIFVCTSNSISSMLTYARIISNWYEAKYNILRRFNKKFQYQLSKSLYTKIILNITLSLWIITLQKHFEYPSYMHGE